MTTARPMTLKIELIFTKSLVPVPGFQALYRLGGGAS